MTELYFFQISEWKKQKDPLEWEMFLPQEKAARLKSIRYERDRDQLIAGDWLISQVLCRKYGHSHYPLRYGYEAGNKPYFLDFQHVHFNLSHAGDLVVAAFSDGTVGIDTEEKSDNGQLMETAKVFMSPKELQHLQNVPYSERNSYFYRIWSAKESYLKFTGEGLSNEIANITIDDSDKWLRVERNHKSIEYIYIHECQIHPNHITCLCSTDKSIAYVHCLC